MCRPDSVRFGLVGRTCGRGIGGPGGASALSDLSLPRRVCVVSNYALARPWFTFLMCPIELDPVQLVMAVYPLTRERDNSLFFPRNGENIGILWSQNARERKLHLYLSDLDSFCDR